MRQPRAIELRNIMYRYVVIHHPYNVKYIVVKNCIIICDYYNKASP